MHQPAVIVKGWAEEIDEEEIDEHEKKPNQYSSVVWTVESGLPDNVINDILQTSDGFLWIATDNGLSRFDGFTFDTIDRKTHPALQSSRISTLLEDQSGNLWFGTFGGGLYTVKKDTLLRFSDEEGLPSNDILPESYVLDLFCDDEGIMWAATSSGVASRGLLP
ncbi:MAG: ligand-binding sensor domain-containing protein [Cyclonatronaceae bacterium]